MAPFSYLLCLKSSPACFLNQSLGIEYPGSRGVICRLWDAQFFEMKWTSPTTGGWLVFTAVSGRTTALGGNDTDGRIDSVKVMSSLPTCMACSVHDWVKISLNHTGSCENNGPLLQIGEAYSLNDDKKQLKLKQKLSVGRYQSREPLWGIQNKGKKTSVSQFQPT
ncbi:predicted protein [Histoplasma capsulatum G186AR]|uniref:Uncharacterized protein n=1 Tax=Ajellomyces capsulatus (strain G186AR / H82 / ATCC MYA-2454 / RMSCC 2432) TaxID=447093 RepID=C0NBE4_AJECG|nr:uncharacterized protein HCBG_00440 [Histoplasma capsulatum G186AR]EEH10985.1 predicted protein [Histoplasma capsulatum G186AR]